jgi:hypothetical protein
MFTFLATALACGLLALSLFGVVAGGVKAGEAMSNYSRGLRQVGEDFDKADLEQIQADQRTAPLVAAQGLAEAAMSAQTIASPDVPNNPIPLGFTDGMSIGQLIVQEADALDAEEPAPSGEEEEQAAEEFATLLWNISIEVGGEWQSGAQLRLEGLDEATLLVEPPAFGSYTLSDDGVLVVTVGRNYPVSTSEGNTMVPEEIVINATVATDYSLQGQMMRDNWKVNSDGTIDRTGTLSYPLRGAFVP